MANSKYSEGRNGLGLANVDMAGDTFEIILLDASYLAIAWDVDDGFIGVDHGFGDLIGILDTITLTGNVFGADGWFTTDFVTSTLGIGDDALCAVLRDDTASLLMSFYDTLIADQPIEFIGDGTPFSFDPPLLGWYRV